MPPLVPSHPASSSTTSFIHIHSSRQFSIPAIIHPPFSHSLSLTVVAILAQVLLDLLRWEAGVFSDSKVGLDVPCLFGVCVLHPGWNGEASVHRERTHRNIHVSLSRPQNSNSWSYVHPPLSRSVRLGLRTGNPPAFTLALSLAPLTLSLWAFALFLELRTDRKCNPANCPEKFYTDEKVASLVLAHHALDPHWLRASQIGGLGWPCAKEQAVGGREEGNNCRGVCCLASWK